MNSVLIVRGATSASGEPCPPRVLCGRSSGAFTIMAGQRGAQGRRGADGSAGGQTLTRMAGQEVSALRGVYESQERAYLIDPASDTSLQLLGVALTAGAFGDDITIQAMGVIDDASWSWTEGLVFVGQDGVLTQIAPTTGWELVVGFASSSTRLNIEFNEPVFLA